MPNKGAILTDMSELLTLQPFVDGHVHFREPGNNPAETIESGTLAAIRGGVAAVNDMSNNSPQPTSNIEAVENKHTIISRDAHCHVGTAAGIQPEYDNIDQFHLMIPKSLTIKAYGGPTTNINRKNDYEAHEFDEVLDKILKVDPKKLIVFHSGQDNYRDFIGHAAQDRGLRVRLAHVNKMDQVNAVNEARDKGLDVRSAVCPHHILLNSNDLHTRSSYADMQPPLVDQAEADELFAALVDGRIQELETDHAPHTKGAKMVAIESNPTCSDENHGTRCCGLPSIEHAASAMFWQVHIGRISLDRLVEVYSDVPSDSMQLIIDQKSYVKWDMEIYRIENEDTQVVSGAGWSPYIGMMAMGKVVEMQISGIKVIENGAVVGKTRQVIRGDLDLI